jgi:heptosyltransferase-3
LTLPRRILVIKSRHIGDVLLTGPLISTLHALPSQPRVTALVKSGTEAMLDGHPHLDGVRVFPEPGPDEGRLRAALRTLGWLRALRREGFDLAINTTEGDRGALAAWLCGARDRIGFTKAGKSRLSVRLLTEPVAWPEDHTHTVLTNLKLAAGLTPHQERTVHLTVAPGDREWVAQTLRAGGLDPQRPVVQVHPTSRWLFKCWHDEGMARAIDFLRAQGLQVVVTAGPGQKERAKLDRILALSRHDPLDLGGRLSLKQLAALTSRCRLFFGVDTAPMHMAAALGVPVIALFGPSGSFHWGPWPNGWQGRATPYPGRNGIQRAGPHTVIQASWSCVPCGQDGCAGSKRSRCLEELAPEGVLAIVGQRLRELELT